MALSARQEKYGPLVIGAAMAVAFVLAVRYGYCQPINKLTELFASAINVAGISIGFLATMKAILLGTRDSPTARVLRDAKQWSPILRQVWWSLAWSFAVAVMSVAALLVSPYVEAHPESPANSFTIGLWAYFVGGALASAYIVIDVLFKIVSED